MPTMKKFAGPPPTISSGAAGKKGFKSQIKKDPSARKRPIESLIYGDEIWQPLIKKEKEIVICFYPFTKNELRISTCGKFIIERFNQYIVDDLQQGLLLTPEELPKNCAWEVHWNLFYFQEPLTDFTPPTDVNLFTNVVYDIDSTKCEEFKDFNSVKDLADKVVELVRAEYFQARQDKLKIEDELRKKKAESEKESNELDSEITGDNKGESNISETSTMSENIEEN